MTAWLLCPYDTRIGPHGRKVRFVALDTFSRQIEAAGGRWSESEIDGDQAIVCIDAPQAILDAIVAAKKGAVLKDRAVAEALVKPRRKGRLDSLGNIVLDGPAIAARPLAEVEAAVVQPRGLRSVPKRSGPNGTGTISSFTGANESPLSEGGVWTNQAYPGTGNMRRISNAAAPAVTDASAWYNAATYDSPCEVFLTAPTFGSTSYFGVAMYLSPGGAGLDGYYVLLDNSSNSCTFQRVDNASETQLGSSVSFSPASGDSIALSLDSGTLELWFIDASVSPGTWVSQGTRSDSTYSTAFLFAIFGGSTNDRYDDFGGGAISTGPTTTNQAVNATGTGTVSAAKSIAKSLGITGAGAAVVTASRAFLQAVSATASGVVSFTKSIGKAVSLTGAGALAITAGQAFLQAVSATASSVVSIVTQVISYQIADTDTLHKPVNCVLASDVVGIPDRKIEGAFEVKVGQKLARPGGSLGKGVPSFSVSTKKLR